MMLSMKREEIQHLAGLARIKLTEEELKSLENELPKILDYVGVVSKIAASDEDTEPQVGARYNVLRKDEITNEPGEYTIDILSEMPATENGYMKVKKILQTED